jgi:hypothetical protein
MRDEALLSTVCDIFNTLVLFNISELVRPPGMRDIRAIDGTSSLPVVVGKTITPDKLLLELLKLVRTRDVVLGYENFYC